MPNAMLIEWWSGFWPKVELPGKRPSSLGSRSVVARATSRLLTERTEVVSESLATLGCRELSITTLGLVPTIDDGANQRLQYTTPNNVGQSSRNLAVYRP